LEGETERNRAELELLQRNIDHIKDIVSMQQSYARMSGVIETLDVTELVEDALRMNESALDRHGVRLVRDYSRGIPPILAERHKILQILINIIRNAKYACDEGAPAVKQITISIKADADSVLIEIKDNGIGIPPENLCRIFNHGFTTRKEGHGFGLHSGALAAKEMEGSLHAASEGIGKGATFTLHLPLRTAPVPLRNSLELEASKN
jgi:signal transduction histidine kinase